MTVKTVVPLAVALLVFGAQSGARAGSDNSFEFARDKSEIHLAGFGKVTEQGKVAADIIRRAFKMMSKSKGAPTIQISWVEDQQLLLDPLLSRKVFDFGFVWEKPDCNAGVQNLQKTLCTGFFFTKPVFVFMPVSGEQDTRRTFHAVIAKSHPRARTYLYYFNAALTRLRASGEYEAIIARYGQRFASQ